MALATWPESLPRPKYRGRIQGRGGLNSPEEKINPARTRTYPEREGSFEVLLTPAQWQDLRGFYRDTLNECAPFTATWLVDMEFTFHRIRFLEAPRADSVDTRWFQATLQLEISTGIERDAGGDPLIWPPVDELTPGNKWG